MKPGELLFVSYCRDDEEEVDHKVRDLEAAGFKIWIDRRNLGPGEDWPKEIEKAIDRVDRFVVFLSRNSVSNWRTQQREINLAFERENRENC